MSEILGVLFKYLLALLGIAAVVAILYEALGSSSVSDAASDVAQMQANVYSLYQGTGDATQFDSSTGTPANLIASGIIPSGMIQNGSIVDPFGQTISGAVTTTGNGSPVLAITFPAVPVKACTKLIMAAVQAGASATVGGTTLYPGAATAVTAAPACGTATATNGNVPITFNFFPNNGASTAAATAATSGGSGS